MHTTAQADGVPVLPSRREAKENYFCKQIPDMEIEGGGNTREYEAKVNNREYRRDRNDEGVLSVSEYAK